MRLLTFERGGRLHTGALVGTGDVLDFTAGATGIPQPADDLDWFDTASPSHAEARTLFAAVDGDAARRDVLRTEGALCTLDSVRLAAPVPAPRKVICIGLNYKDHAAESGMELPERPLLFSKFPTAVVGPGANVLIPEGSEQVDFEAELAIVIGRETRRVDAGAAMEHVLGYANFNDVSARDFQFADGQWQRGKSCDTFAPLGPWITTADAVPDPHRLRISFRLNGETLQDSNTDQLIFGVPELVSFISRTITLEPGDVIASGTPPGVGFARKPPVFVEDGDRMEVEIEGLGVLANTVSRER